MIGSEPEQVAHWVNGVGDVYVQRNLEKAQQAMADAIDRIRTQLEDLREEFSDAEETRFQALSIEDEAWQEIRERVHRNVVALDEQVRRILG